MAPLWFKAWFSFDPQRFPNRWKIVTLAALTFVALC